MRRPHYFRNSIIGLFVVTLLVAGVEMFAHNSLQSCGIKLQKVSCISIDGTTCIYSFTLDVTNNTGSTGPTTLSGANSLNYSPTTLQPGLNTVSGTFSVACGTPSVSLTLSLGGTSCTVQVPLPKCSCNPSSPGAIACTVGSAGQVCPANHEFCSGSVVNLTDPNTPGPNCSRKWYQWNGSVWQLISGGATITPTLTSSTCPFTLAKFRVVYSCTQCPDTFSEISFKVYSPAQGGTITAPPICEGAGDILTLAGSCGDIVQWESSPTGIAGSFNAITGSGGAYTWSTNQIPPHNEYYQVLVKNGPCGPAYSNVFHVTVNHKPNPTISAGGPVTFCAPGSVPITATNPNGGSCSWYRNGLLLPTIANLMTYSASVSGNYYVVCTDNTNNCGTTKSNIIKVTASKPVAAILGACGVCPPNCVTLSAVHGGGVQPYNYNWSTGQNTSTISVCPTTNTTYTVTVTDAIGCTSPIATHTVDVCPQKLVADAGKNVTTCPGGPVTIGGAPTASGGTGPYTYSWSPAIGLNNATIANPTATPGQTTTYTVTITDANGCVVTSAVTVTVKGPPCALKK